METKDKLMMRALAGHAHDVPPVWLMRQAGRYLPEYKATRAQAGGFLDLCYAPELAAEVTLQPIRRYGFDAAIMFADILLVPQALGAKLWFETGEGPRLEPIASRADFDALAQPGEVHETLNPIYETLKILKAELPAETTRIGFAGAPWTVATYMIAGRGTPDQGPARRMIYQDPQLFDDLMERITLATIEYLSKQVEAGAEVLKLFDSWAGALPGALFERYSTKPISEIVSAIRARHPSIAIIGFPRGAGANYRGFAKTAGIDCLALDTSVPDAFARELQTDSCVQGNLDPLLMVTGGEALKSRAKQMLDGLKGGPYVVNLGHGITPDADPENVNRLLEVIRG